MSREIEFRLINNKAIVGYERHRLICVGTKKTIYMCIEHSPDGVGFCDIARTDVSWHWIEHQKKDQFTGLRDGKRTEEYPEGQKIFKSDIIETEDGVGHVIFYNGIYWVRFVAGVQELVYCSGTLGEVIGNLHQHPELLEPIKGKD